MAIPYKNSRTLCFFLILSFGLCLVITSAELERFEHPTKEDGSLSFLVLGDWGRRGAFNQSQVAFQVPQLLMLLVIHIFYSWFLARCIMWSHSHSRTYFYKKVMHSKKKHTRMIWKSKSVKEKTYNSITCFPLLFFFSLSPLPAFSWLLQVQELVNLICVC